MPTRCAACQSEVPDAHKFCGACGAPAGTPTQAVTVSAPVVTAARRVSPSPAARSLATPGGGQGFTPGAVIAGRYRVINLLGRGGMGEVYRADDLKLGQAVALKFLPPALAADPLRLERFLAEVRLARQVSHPNICRVYDIADFEGQPFLTMEYIDGEDLGSLLRRIGRLPADKALDIARQITAGLAAAHDRGVLHRDLKPANVMIDGRGRARLTDFGLAVAADAARRWDVSGTPAYMAPEQLAGEAASVRTDVYALGLVLYELYTGRPPFAAATLDELIDRKRHEAPLPPSKLIAEIDPAIERVLMRAMAADPSARPASAADVAAALPGGSLIEGALKAGDTPSPELVAASGRGQGLGRATAWAVLALVALASVAAARLGADGLLWRRHAPDRAPEVLADHARQLLTRLGYPERPPYRASGFEVDLPYLRFLQTRHPTRWRTIDPEPSILRFWYRDSPQPLEAWRFLAQYGNVSRVTPADPPLETRGMTLLRLDPSGRLTQFVVVPQEAAGAAAPSLDWQAVLAHAGYDPSQWTAAAPELDPPVFADARAAWTGRWPGAADVSVRLEAAALRGRTVYFEAIYPWTAPARTPGPILTSTERAELLSAFAVVAAVIAGIAVLAQRNVRAGRGDRRGAFRVSAFVFAAMIVSWFFGERHVATLWEVALAAMAVGWALLAAGFCWIAYLAAEPFLRRRWPEVLVTWTRLLAGDLRDPLVGRDVLVGCAAAACLAVVAVGGFLLPERLGMPSNLAFVDVYGLVYGVQAVVPLLVWRAAQSVMAGLAGVFLLLMFRLALRSQPAAVAAFALTSGLALAGSDDFWIAFPLTAMHFGVFAWLIARFGLLAAIVQFYVWALFIFFPITSDLGAWYAGGGVAALLVLTALALFGFTAARGGGRAPEGPPRLRYR